MTKIPIPTKIKEDDFAFITEIIQRGRSRPAKYAHSIVISQNLYSDLKLRGIIKPEAYFTYETAFFESDGETVVISFVNRNLCDGLQFAIDRFLITSLAGKYPVERKYQSKMNRDKHIGPERLIK